MLSSSEIENYEFKKGIGYSKKSVDDFISEIVKDYEAVCKENIELKDKATVLSEGLQYYRSIEKTLQKALVLAQKTADEEQAKAAKNARIIEKAAHTKADEVLTQAKAELDAVFRQTDDLNRRFELYKAHVKNLITTQLDLINSDSYNISVNDLEGYLKLKEKLEDGKGVNPGDISSEEVLNDVIETDKHEDIKSEETEPEKVEAEEIEPEKVETGKDEAEKVESEEDILENSLLENEGSESEEIKSEEAEKTEPNNKENSAEAKESLINRIPNETVRREGVYERLHSENNERDVSSRRVSVNRYRNGESGYEQNT